MPKGNKALREVIKGGLLTQLNELWNKAGVYHDGQKGDNIQGTKHCIAVEKNLEKLIPDDKKEKELKPIDLFVLSAAACLHDIGKVVADDAKGWEGDHGKRSMEIILEEYDKLGLDKGQAIAVGYVVSVHGDGKLDELPRNPITIGNEEINIIELAAIFRLADMLDTNYQRAPEILSAIKFPDGKVPSKWRGRQAITGWYLDEQDRIILQANPKPDEIDAVYTLKSMMNEDLAKISPYLKLHKYPSELGELDLGDVFIKHALKKKAISKRPFPGMAFYTKEERNIFKGRDKEIEDLLAIVSRWPITVLIGESGAGKTSLIHAGLFPRLDTMLWKYVWTRPFENPEENIKKMIWSAFFEGNADPKKTLLDVMREAAEKCKPHKLLVVMDQFEDVLNCSVQEILNDFCLCLTAVQTGTVIPNLRVLIAFREDSLIKINTRLLKRITGSSQQFPSVELERLTREGAKEALLSGLENAEIGLDPRLEKGQKPLIEIILDDIQKGDDRLYPPYIQMVAETLSMNVDKNNPVIERETYFEQLKGAKNIIARYLIDRLKEFGSQKGIAEKILVFLTSSSGKKAQKNLMELNRQIEIEIYELKEIVNKMIDLRMVRTSNEEEFEIIHDYLAKIVDEELVQEEDRTIKFLEEQLDSYYQQYKVHRIPIMNPPFMASLYRNRRRLKISEENYQIIFYTCLLDDMGLGWYWVKDLDIQKIFKIIDYHISHGEEFDLEDTFAPFLKRIKSNDKDFIIEMLDDKVNYVRDVALMALEKIAEANDRNHVIKMMYDEDEYVRLRAFMAFKKVAVSNDRNYIIEMLHNNNWSVREAAFDAFVKIAKPEDRSIVFEMLNDTDGEIRYSAIQAFLKIIKPIDRRKILEMLNDKNENIRNAAMKVFHKIAKRGDWDKILEMLHDKDWSVKESAIAAFVKIAEPGDWDKILEMLHDVDSSVREAAKDAFVKITRPGDRGIVFEMLNDTDKEIRHTAIRAFEKVAKPDDLDMIIELLHDENHFFRDVATETFVKIAKPEDRDKIIEMLKDEKGYIRIAAAGAFGKIARPKDKDNLTKMLYDEFKEIRIAALKALIKMGKPEDIESLLDLLADDAQGWSNGDRQKESFELLSELDRKLYCPYYDELKRGRIARGFGYAEYHGL